MAGKKAMEALQNHHNGFNCAQSVVLPFCEELGLARETMARAMEGFGGGMGGYELTCGALSGAVLVASLKVSGCTLEDGPVTKLNTYEICKKTVEDFREACGSDCCPVIKGIKTGKPLASCDKCIMTGASLAEKITAK